MTGGGGFVAAATVSIHVRSMVLQSTHKTCKAKVNNLTTDTKPCTKDNRDPGNGTGVGKYW